MKTILFIYILLYIICLVFVDGPHMSQEEIKSEKRRMLDE